MPKDARGHGSNPRGGGRDQKGLEKRHGLKSGDLGDPRSRAAYRASEALAKGDFKAADAIRRSVGLPGGNADRAAASQLASGPKSAPAPVHEAMREAAFREKDPAKLSEGLSKAYHAEHGWSGDVGKHKGG